MHRKLSFIAIFIAAISLQAVELVKEGKAVSEIVVPENPVSPQVNYAAKELQEHIKKISGAELPIVTKPSEKYKNLIYLGESEATKKAGISVDDIKKEGFKITAKGDNLYIVGHDMPKWQPIPRENSYPFRWQKIKQTKKDWKKFTGENWEPPGLRPARNYNPKADAYGEEGCGTLFGVYEFLESLGVRWYMPDEELGTVIPKKKDIVINDMEIKKEPLLSFRYFHAFPRMAPTWNKRLRLGGSIAYWSNHTLIHITDNNEKTHPEYFDTIDGKIDAKGCCGHARQLFFPPLQKAMVKYLDKCFQAFPELTYGAVGESDGYGYPGDIAKKAGWDKLKERGQSGRMSDYFWTFVKNVASDVGKKYPEKYVIGIAYSTHRLVPENIDKLPPNVAVTYCQSRDTSMLPANRSVIHEDREAWFKKMSNNQFFIWDYYLVHSWRHRYPPIPAIFTKIQSEEAKKLYGGKQQGEFIECSFDWDKKKGLTVRYPGINHLTYYLQSKLYWDKDLDLNAFMDDYCEKFYGPAKDEMREFFNFAEEVWTRPESRTITQYGGFIKPKDVEKYFDILKRAKEKAGDSIYGKRIALIENEIQPLKKLFDKLKRTGPTVRAFETKIKPEINGDLDKPFWFRDKYGNKIGAPMKDLVTGELPHINGGDVSFMWNNDNLLIGVTCYESRMSKLRAKIKDNDNIDIFYDDLVEIYIETPEKSYFKIAVNPNGAVWDECTQPSIEQPDPLAWSSEAKVAVKKYDDRWTVEIMIPAKNLGGKPVINMPWGINVCRSRMVDGIGEYSAISPTGKNKFAVLTRMANLYAK